MTRERRCICGGCVRLVELERIEAETADRHPWADELYDIDPHNDRPIEPDPLDAEPDAEVIGRIVLGLPDRAPRIIPIHRPIIDADDIDAAELAILTSPALLAAAERERDAASAELDAWTRRARALATIRGTNGVESLTE